MIKQRKCNICGEVYIAELENYSEICGREPCKIVKDVEQE